MRRRSLLKAIAALPVVAALGSLVDLPSLRPSVLPSSSAHDLAGVGVRKVLTGFSWWSGGSASTITVGLNGHPLVRSSGLGYTRVDLKTPVVLQENDGIFVWTLDQGSLAGFVTHFAEF